MSVPVLRFPEFEGEWEEKQLDEIADQKISYGIVQAGPHVPDGMPYIKSKDLNTPLVLKELERTSDAIAKSYQRSEVRPGDIVFSLRGNIGVSQIVPNSIAVANLTQGTARISVKKLAINTFVYGSLETRKIRKRIFSVMKGSTFQEISLADLRQIKLQIPTLPEQKKIAAFLGVVDAKIAALRARRAGLERYKRGLMQALFSQALRFTRSDGSAFPDWEEKRLGEVLHEHKAKSTGKEEVFSVSVHKGLVNQIEHLGRSFSAANTDHYNRVKPDDIVYTKSPTGDFPLGIIKQSHIETDVIVSPLYGVFTPETPALGRILHVHFESNVNVANYLSPIVQKGAKNTINVTNAGFLSNKLTLPVDHDEQAKIADALSAMDAKIAAVGDQVAKMETLKKGLLQQMFV